MSNTAAIFMKDYNTDLYSGVIMCHSGYPEYLGRMLLNHWTDKYDVDELCSNNESEIQEFGEDIFELTWFPYRKAFTKELKQLTYEEMMNRGKQENYFYVFTCDEPDDYRWLFYDKALNGFCFLDCKVPGNHCTF